MNTAAKGLSRVKQFVAIAIAAVLLTIIYVPFQRATAFTVSINLPDDTDDAIPQSVVGENFEIVIDVAPGELISVEEVTLILDNGEPSVAQTVFGSTGQYDSGSTGLVVNNEIVISAFSDSGYAYGYGMVSDGITGQTGYSYNFVSTEDFIGGNQDGPDTPGTTDFVIGLLGPGQITITGKLRTADLASGPHTLDVLIDTGAGANPDQLTTNSFDFTVQQDDSVVITQTNVPPASTTANITTTDSNNNPINLKLHFDAPTTNNGNAVVTVQSVDDFRAGKTAGQLAQLGLTQSGSQLEFTTDDDDNAFIAVGFIMDVDLSALGLPDGTLVTLEMDYDDTGLSSSEENRLRLMHQLDSGDEWEALTNDDDTINDGDEVDTENNIVYGTTDDFSLFGPAVREAISTGGGGGGSGGGGGGGSGGGGGGGRSVVLTWPPLATQPDSYFEDRPLERFKVTGSGFSTVDGVGISQVQAGQQITISGTFVNQQQKAQTYAFIMQVTDENDVVTDLMWQIGTLGAGSMTDVSNSWTPKAPGTYKVTIFVWDGISLTASPLSEVSVMTIQAS